MRLINTETGLLEEFIGEDIPEYAILSHTWEKDEISLQEFQRLTDPDFANDPKTSIGKAKAGYIKIRGCVELAVSKKIPYIWVDTCCIDKTSSADLMESINSMYQWYANSKACFAYLIDIKTHGWMNRRSSWMKSRWFTRGWTLQELIAPPAVKFYSRSWDLLGTRESWSGLLSNITGIQREVLETSDLSSASVAQKMSWASNRKTTRKEDMAYCLLGLFDINMPLLYGEGEKAFLRLQEHIAATSTDHSLFAWSVPSEGAAGANARSYRSIFARSPAEFAECGKLEEKMIVHPDTWTQTNRGLHAVFPTIPAVVVKQLLVERGVPGTVLGYIDDKDYLVILNCRLQTSIIGIWISLIEERDDGKHGFCRVTNLILLLRPQDEVSKLINSSPDKFRKDLWLATISRKIQLPCSYFSKRLGGFLVPPPSRRGSGPLASFKIHSLYGSHVSDKADVLTCPLLPLLRSGGLVGVVTIKIPANIYEERPEGNAAVVFGYPPSLMRPFVKVISHWKPEAPLDYNFQRLVEGGDNYDDKEKDDNEPLELDGLSSSFDYKCEQFALKFSLSTVLHEDVIFTQLDIDLYTWY
jgi:hypothetical protein